MRASVSAAVLLCLAACAPEREQVPPAPEVTVASPHGTERPNFPAPETIVGEYRVAGIDGEALDANYGIAVSITADRISFEPTCAGFVWTYEYGPDGRLTTRRHPEYGGKVTPDGSVVVCAVGLKPTDLPLARALDTATRAGRTPANAVELSGGGRSITLFSQ